MSDMRLRLILLGNNSGLNQVLSGAESRVKRFTQSAGRDLTRLQAHSSRIMGAINGASTAAKMIGVGAAAGGLKSVIDDNLAFERTLLKMKFNAQMTTRELAELRKMAIDLSKTTVNSPLDIANMQLRLAMAGLKMPMIRQLAPSIAGAAQVFEAEPGEIANLVFDKIAKTSIKPERVPQMLDMLYYHGTSGRFETSDMARQAPELLNAGAGVGLTGENGLNLMGALTQRMMRNATVSIPSEVSTLVKHGLGHITQKHYVKKLGKYGIDVPSYFDNRGRFKGDGGVDGLLALTRKMIDKGLENPFKLSEAGFRDQYTKTFWLEMMRSVKAADTDTDPNLLKMMERGRAAMESGQLATNLGVIKEANFGKIKAAEIEIQKLKVSDAGQTVTGMAGSAANLFSEHPVAASAAAVGTVLAGKYLMNKLGRGKGGGAGMLDELGGKGGAMPVFVTNWPSNGPMKASERMRNLPGAGNAGTQAAAAGGAAATAKALGLAALRVAPVLALSGDSKQQPYDPEWGSKLDEVMRAQGMQRQKGWLFDSYVPIPRPAKENNSATRASAPGMKPAEGKQQDTQGPIQRLVKENNSGSRASAVGMKPAEAKQQDIQGSIQRLVKERGTVAKMSSTITPPQEGVLLNAHVPVPRPAKVAVPAEAVLQKEVRDAIKAIEAAALRPIEVHIDGVKVAEAVNKHNGRDGRRQ